MSEEVTEKSCSKCGVVKPLKAFKRQSAGKHGRTAACYDCVNALRRNRYAQTTDQERQRQRDKYWANPEAGRQRTRDWRTNNPELNLSVRRQAQQRRVALQLGATVGLVDDAAVRFMEGPCYLCGQPLPDDRMDGRKVHVDHVHPLARGGEHSMSNLRPTHPGCNLRKSDRLLSELDWYVDQMPPRG